MERRTHSSSRASPPHIMSRLQKDLSESSHQKTETSTNGEANPMLRRTVSKGRIPHVGVIGAGVAGLRCADVLLQHGVKVTILEGRDRVGGRLCQSSQLGHLVDLGPNWIHGTDHNPILDLAKETGTTTSNWDGRQAVFDKGGRKLPEKDAGEFTERVWEIIEAAMSHSNEHSATIPASKSLYDFFEEKAKEMFPSEGKNGHSAEQDRERLLSMAEMWGAFVGSPIQKQSLKFFWLEECIDGENLFVAETYHKVLARIAQEALKGAEVRFKNKVTKIISNEGAETSKVMVETSGGGSLSFDEVVSTTPLGWLKQNQQAFVPPLPSRLQQAIESIGYGHLDKVYITFPTAFWEESQSSTNGATPVPTQHQASSPNVTATTAPLHQPPTPESALSSAQHYPGFTHWTRPNYAPDTNPSHWNQECVNLAALPSPTSHPTLLFYTYGPTSLHIAHLLRTSPSPIETQNTLFAFFTPYFSRLPNYDPSSASCRPIQALATGWANDELAGYGSYCNFQVGLEKGDEDVEVMRSGVPERGLWLAGEHTAPFVALGTVTGAWWAGEGVARRILGEYGIGEGKEEKVENGAE